MMPNISNSDGSEHQRQYSRGFPDSAGLEGSGGFQISGGF